MRLAVTVTPRIIRTVLSSLLLAAAPSLALAQAGPDTDRPDREGPATDWTFTIGAAGIYTPDFLGSEDYSLVPVPDLKIEYKDAFFASFFDGVGYNVLNSGGWRAGPVVKYAFGREEDDNDALKGLGDIDGTVEIGGFLEYELEPFSAKLELRQGVNGHEGLIGEVGLNYSNAVDLFGPPVFFSFGPRLSFGDESYNSAFFGIDGTQSASSGLARYDAEAGIVSYGIGGFAMMPVTDAISINLFGGYDRLGSQGADSPLVAERGSENQFMVGFGVSYRFGY